MTSFEDIIFSRTARIVWAIAGGVLLLGLVFDAGLAIGVRAAIHRGPDMPPPDFLWGVHGFMPEGHGAVGTITTVSSSTVTLKTREGDTEVVHLTGETNIDDGNVYATTSDLYPGENIIVLGEPYDGDEGAGAVDAHIIRALNQ